jgi:hypothetical protein
LHSNKSYKQKWKLKNFFKIYNILYEEYKFFKYSEDLIIFCKLVIFQDNKDNLNRNNNHKKLNSF